VVIHYRIHRCTSPAGQRRPWRDILPLTETVPVGVHRDDEAELLLVNCPGCGSTFSFVARDIEPDEACAAGFDCDGEGRACVA
jgi:hypothetical protein